MPYECVCGSPVEDHEYTDNPGSGVKCPDGSGNRYSPSKKWLGDKPEPGSENDVQLLPCPFCGDSAWLQKIYQTLPDGGLSKVPQYFIQCKEGGCESMTGLCGMAETAVGIWNRRVV